MQSVYDQTSIRFAHHFSNIPVNGIRRLYTNFSLGAELVKTALTVSGWQSTRADLMGPNHSRYTVLNLAVQSKWNWRPCPSKVAWNQRKKSYNLNPSPFSNLLSLYSSPVVSNEKFHCSVFRFHFCFYFSQRLDSFSLRVYMCEWLVPQVVSMVVHDNEKLHSLTFLTRDLIHVTRARLSLPLLFKYANQSQCFHRMIICRDWLMKKVAKVSMFTLDSQFTVNTCRL